MFGKQNRAALFFCWLKSRIEQSRFVLCLVESHMSVEGRRGRRVLASKERSHPVVLVEREHYKYLW
jgi:hypothetical protein